MQWCEDNGYSRKMNVFTFKEDMCSLYDMEIAFERINEGEPRAQVFFKRGEFDENYKPF